MPKKGEKASYQVGKFSAGQSKFPISRGILLKLNKPAKLRNPKIGAIYPHETYVFVMRLFKLRRGLQPKYRRVKVIYCFVPIGNRSKIIVRNRTIAHYSLTRVLKRRGYSVLKGYISFNKSKDAWYKLYSELGLLPKKRKSKPDNIIINQN